MAGVESGIGIAGDVRAARSQPAGFDPFAGVSTPTFGAGFEALGQFVSGFNAFRQGKFGKEIAFRNAEQVELSTRVEVEEIRLDRRKRLASTRASAAASGAQLTGSILDILAAEAAEGERAALLARFSGRIAAQELRLKGEIAKSRGRAGLISGITSGVITLASDRFTQTRRGQIA